MARNRQGTPRRQRGRSQGRRNNNKNNNKSKGGKDKPKAKVLEDYIYYVGSSSNASECVTNTNYILNHIKLEFEEGRDIATAIQTGVEYDFQAERPVLEHTLA